MPNGKELLIRRDKMRNARANFDARIDKMAKFFDPTIFGVNTKSGSPGQSVTDVVYDSTGQNAFTILSNFLQNELINPGKKYINIAPSHPAAKEDDGAKEWCEAARDTTLNVIAKSNFYTEAGVAIKSWLFGAGSLFWGERIRLPNEKDYGFKGLRFQSDKAGRFFIARNANGEVDTNFREFEVSARTADEMFPEASPAAKFKKDLEKNQDNMHKFVHCVYPRPNNERGYGSKGFPWASCYVEDTTAEICKEGGFPWFPFACPTWEKVPGEDYGRGPVEMAYNDMMSKNLNRQQKFEAGELKNRPPLAMTHDSVIGSIRLLPAGATFFKTYQRSIRDVIMPLDVGGDLEWNKDIDNDLKQAINAALFIDVIVQLMQQDLKDVNNYTFAKKLEILYKLLGPNYGRFEHEFLRALFDPLVVFLYTQGLFGRPPDILLETGGNIDVEFENPLARVQMVDEINAVNLVLADLAPWIDIELKTKQYSEIMDRYDLDGLAKLSEKRNMMSATAIRSQQDIDALRKSRAEKMAEQAQKQDLMQATQGAKNLAPMMKMSQNIKEAQPVAA